MYQLLRTETELKTGIQHIVEFGSSENPVKLRGLLFLFIKNAINLKFMVTDCDDDGFVQHFGDDYIWKFEIVKYS